MAQAWKIFFAKRKGFFKRNDPPTANFIRWSPMITDDHQWSLKISQKWSDWSCLPAARPDQSTMLRGGRCHRGAINGGSGYGIMWRNTSGWGGGGGGVLRGGVWCRESPVGDQEWLGCGIGGKALGVFPLKKTCFPALSYMNHIAIDPPVGYTA